MKKAQSRKAKPSSRRDLFAELREGFESLAEAREGKRTLRTHVVQFRAAPALSPEDVIRVREKLKMSRAVFAAYLRTNVRTLDNWEQGRAQPNAQAALLISLVKNYPDTMERLAQIWSSRGALPQPARRECEGRGCAPPRVQMRAHRPVQLREEYR